MTTKTKIMALSFSAIGMLTIANIYSGNSEYSYKQQNKVDQKQQTNERVIESGDDDASGKESQKEFLIAGLPESEVFDGSFPKHIEEFHYINSKILKSSADVAQLKKNYQDKKVLKQFLATVLETGSTEVNLVKEKYRFKAIEFLSQALTFNLKNNNLNLNSEIEDYLLANSFNRSQTKDLRKSIAYNKFLLFRAMYLVDKEYAMSFLNRSRGSQNEIIFKNIIKRFKRSNV